jgi:hypothetical protein
MANSAPRKTVRNVYGELPHKEKEPGEQTILGLFLLNGPVKKQYKANIPEKNGHFYVNLR